MFIILIVVLTGNIVINERLWSNDTHVEVITTTQILGFMATPLTRFYIILRNPTDR